MNKMTKNKKAQAWGIDLMIAMAIFVFGILMFFFYTANQPGETKEIYESLFYDGSIVADSILSEGHPKNWQQDSVVTIGILNDNKINETKLERFYELSVADYSKTKILFNTKYNYYVFLSEPMTIDSEEIEGIGLNPEAQETDNLVKITRFTVYKNKPVTMTIYIFE